MNTLTNESGIDFSYLFSPIQTLNYLIVVVAVLLMIGAIYFLAHHVPKNLKELGQIKKKILSYQDLTSWILRLGLGALLIGGAVNNVFLIPNIPYFPSVISFEIIIGICLLFGFLITPSVLAIIGFYLAGIIESGFLIGNLEILGSAIAILILSNSRPSFDDLLNVPELLRNKWAKYAPLVLRISLGCAFIFLAFYEKIFNPHYFSAIVENKNLMAIIPVTPPMWALLFGLVQLIIGLFILFGFKTRVTSVMALMLSAFTFYIFKNNIYAFASIFAVISVLFITGGGHLSIDDLIEHPPKKARKATSKKSSIKKKPRKSSTKKRVRKTPIAQPAQ